MDEHKDQGLAVNIARGATMGLLRVVALLAPIALYLAFGSLLDAWSPGFILAYLATFAGILFRLSKKLHDLAGLVVASLGTVVAFSFGFNGEGFGTVLVAGLITALLINPWVVDVLSEG